MPPSLNHLAAALPLPDPAFDAFFEAYLHAMPAFNQGATIELNREQLRTLLKITFLSGREAALRELGGL